MTATPPDRLEHFEVLVVGAGLSGVGAGYYLKTRCPNKRFAIFEARSAVGGTWDLFRYPGIRSDSDMFTLGYSFKPWLEAKAIADGPSILKYVNETAAECGIDKLIRTGHRVVRAGWSSADARWTVDVEVGEGEDAAARHLQLPAHVRGLLQLCARLPSAFRRRRGVQRPDRRAAILARRPRLREQARGGDRQRRHGDDALVPAMADTAAHVTMLQRSPTYIVSRPSEDSFANTLQKVSAVETSAYAIVRWRNVVLGMWFFNYARKKPEKVKAGIIDLVRKELGADYDVNTHFTPRYNPWDQRLCLVPDSDLFQSIKSGKTTVVTDTIDGFTAEGIALSIRARFCLPTSSWRRRGSTCS